MKHNAIDAISLLIQDHKEVKDLFTQFDGLSDRAKTSKKIVANHICHELTVHAQIEEEIFYPKVRKVINETALMDEALEEHADARDLIMEIQGMTPNDDLYDDKVQMLSEQVQHHVKEEEEEMFPSVRKSGIDLVKLGNAMIARKNEIESDELIAGTRLGHRR